MFYLTNLKNRLPYRLLFLVLLVAIVASTGCSSSTKVTNTWKSPDIAPDRYDKLFVTVLTGDITSKKTFEDQMARQLSQQGIEVTKSLDIFTPDFTDIDNENDKGKILNKVRESGGDAILTIALVDEKDETRYVPGTNNVMYNPVGRFNYYGNFWGYYSHHYPMTANPGYYVEDKVYFLETNLYDAKTEKLVWSSQSRSYNPSDAESFSEEFAQVTIEQMREENVIN